MMKAAGVLLIFVFLLLHPGTAAADGPVIGSVGGDRPGLLTPEPFACWSEPPDSNGTIGSSEQIAASGLESEIANDFVVSGTIITRASWGWAWFDEAGPCDNHPTTPGFNLRFYENDGCLPGTLIADLSITAFTEEYLGCRTQPAINTMYRATTDVAVDVVAGQTYWCGVQVKDHAFPPQAGRLATGAVTGCASAFKSAYFGYPAWAPTSTVWGFAWDASQEFYCGTTPVRDTDWGEIKALFRPQDTP